MGNSGTAARQAASANYRAAQAQATSNLYASGAGDVRDTSPLPEQTLPEITVSAPRMTQAEIYAFDRLNPGAADASTQYDSITPIGEVEGFFTFNPTGRALKGAGTAAFDAWTALPNALRGIGTLASDAVGYAGNAIAPQRSVLTGQPFQYQPQSALLQSIQQQGVQGTLGAGITGLVRNAPGIGLIAALGTPRRDWGNVGAQVFNTGMAGAVASMRGAPVETTSPVDKSWKLKIDGTAQATGNDAAHQIRTYREAIALAKNPDIVSVNLDHGYNRVLGLDPKTISPNRRPDVTAIYSDGRVARVEVQSATDNPAILRSRNAALDAQIRAQGYTPLPPRVVVPTRPPKP